jgi:uncharacterized YigZ family protein
LKGPSDGLYKEKGSKFIALAFAVETEDNIKAILSDVKKKYFDARHHCYAWVLGTEQTLFRSNDDGEPSGSAGKPILNQIYSFGLTNTLIIVVRYFGGIKLGVSGLVNAYKTAAREALSSAMIEEKTINITFSLQFQYPLMNDVMRIMKEENLQQLNSKFEMDCYFETFCRKSEAEKVLEKFQNIYGLTIKTSENL